MNCPKCDNINIYTEIDEGNPYKSICTICNTKFKYDILSNKYWVIKQDSKLDSYVLKFLNKGVEYSSRSINEYYNNFMNLYQKTILEDDNFIDKPISDIELKEKMSNKKKYACTWKDSTDKISESSGLSISDSPNIFINEWEKTILDDSDDESIPDEDDIKNKIEYYMSKRINGQ